MAQRDKRKTTKAQDPPSSHESDNEAPPVKRKRKKGPPKKLQKLPKARDSDSDASVAEVEDPGPAGVEVEYVILTPQCFYCQLMKNQLEGRRTYLGVALGTN